jgi:hypothetical protein
MKNLISDMIIKYSTPYTQKAAVEEEFNKISKETPIEDLYSKYLIAIDISKHADQMQATCKSDYSYWGYIATYETYRVVAKIYAKLIFDLLNLDYLPEIQSLQLKANKYEEIKHKVDRKIAGLTEFKPNGYKSKIELLEDLLK